jgi:hypothetical protein
MGGARGGGEGDHEQRIEKGRDRNSDGGLGFPRFPERQKDRKREKERKREIMGSIPT